MPSVQKKHPDHRLSVGAPLKKDKFSKLISLTLSEKTPLRAFLSALCAQHDINFACDPGLHMPAVSYRAHKQSIREVVAQLCKLANLRFEFEGNTLSIGKNVPYFKSYDVQFLLGSRQADNHLSITSDVGSSHLSRAGGTNSNTVLSSHAKVNFWEELEENIKILLGQEGGVEMPHVPRSAEEEGTGQRKAVLATSVPCKRYTFHRQAGLLSIYGNAQTHRRVARYLTCLRKRISCQVLVEAKIVEVMLREEFKTGIDWRFISKKMNSLGQLGDPALKAGADAIASTVGDGGFTTLGLNSGQLGTALSFMSHFGTVRTISNPRMTVLNNQPAVFKVAQNEVFFTLSMDRVMGGQNRPDIETVTSQMQTIPIGLVMNVQPSINLETEEITLAIRPTISRVVERRADPAVAMQSKNTVRSEVPVVQVREMDSMIKIRSNQVVVMGGLIEEVAQNSSDGPPGTRGTWLGGLLGGKADDNKRSELVIFLTVRLVDKPSLSLHEQEVYTGV